MILERITDTTLRRLYRFVLKRLLGPCIADGDLSLDQISLKSRDGIVELTDLSLNCSYLNEFLRKGNPATDIAMKFKEVKVASIIAKISYSNILEDGISFVVSGVQVHVEPCQSSGGDGNINFDNVEVDSSSLKNSSEVTSRSSLNAHPSIDTGNNQQTMYHESNDTDALKFLSSWIEIIISKLRISISDITISIYGHDDGKEHSQNRDRSGDILEPPFLILSCKDVHFYNSHNQERHRVNESSIDLSFRAQNARSSIHTQGKEKLLLIGKINCKIANGDHDFDLSQSLFEIDEECKLRLSTSKNRFGAFDTEIDVSVPNMKIFLSGHSIGILTLLANQYFQKNVDSSNKMETVMETQTDKVMNLMKHLERLEGKEDSEIDFVRLNYFMEEYKKALEGIEVQQCNVGGTGRKNYDENDEDEDIAFPESDDEDDDRDRSNRNDESSLYMKSIYGADTFHSTMFKSTFEGPSENNTETSNYRSSNNYNGKHRNGKDSTHFRIHIISTILEMVLNDKNERSEDANMAQYGNEVIQMLFDTSIIDFVTTDSSSRMTCSISRAVISDKESNRKIIEFFEERSARTIISSPNIEIEVKNDSSTSAFRNDGCMFNYIYYLLIIF